MNTVCEPTTQSARTVAKETEDEVIALRRELHKIPELGWQETKTLQMIEERIQEYSENSLYPVAVSRKKGGIVADLEIKPDAEKVLFRADVDGLPIEEQTHLPFQSIHEGRMHACGHDCHTAMLLIAFKLLCNGKFTPTKNIRFVWQQAEEVVDPTSGGDELVRGGVCNGISTVHGLHISSNSELGLFRSMAGAMMCNADHLLIEVNASGGHVMFPQIGSNAIDIMTDIHLALRGFDTRILGPHEPISFIPSVSNAGNVSNIRPNQGKLTYTLRNFLSSERMEFFLSALEKKIESIISSYPFASLSRFEFVKGHPLVINSIDSVSQVQENLDSMGFVTMLEPELLFSGEDFAYFLQQKEGSFWTLGAKEGESWDHHTPFFNPSEKALPMGVAYWLSLAR